MISVRSILVGKSNIGDHEHVHQMIALRDSIKQRDPHRSIATIPTQPAIDRAISFNDPMMRALLAGRKSQTRRLVTDTVHCVRGTGKRAKLIDADGDRLQCSHARVGGKLWVRERWRVVDHRTKPYRYAADLIEGSKLPLGLRWRPSFQMPRIASRISLRVTSIFPQRIQSITASDARAEGFDPDACDARPSRWFRTLWDSIYSKPGLTWHENPWVWVIAFDPCI